MQWYIDSAEGVTPQFLARFVPLMASDDFTERLSELDMPIMLAVPDPDPMVERSEYARMRAYVRRLTLRRIPRRGPQHDGRDSRCLRSRVC